MAERALRWSLPRAAVQQAAPRRRPALSVLWAVAVAVPFLFLLLASVGPLVDQAVGSLFNWYDIHPASFAGLRYYGEVLSDPDATAAIVHTVVYVGITVPIEVVLGVVGAWLVFRARRGRAALTVFFVLPLAIPWASTATMLTGILGATSGFDGAINHVIGNSTPYIWYLDPHLAFGAIVFAGIWKGAPWCFLLMLAAFRTAPPELFEAGRVDGGQRLSYWRDVVVPVVWPMLVFVVVFRLFTEAQMAQSVDLLTQGGPFNATELIGSYANGLAFGSLRFAEAEALATGTGLALLVLALGAFALTRRPQLPLLGSLPGSRRERRPSSPTSPLSWVGASKRRTRRAATAALLMAGVIELLPLAGALPRGALGAVFRFGWSEVGTGLANSAIMTVGTLVGTLVLGVPAAYMLAQGRFRGRSALFGLVLVAMAVPGALTLFPQAQALVSAGLNNTRVGVILIYISLDLPLAIFFLRAAFAAVPKPLVESMRVDGASPAKIATRLFLPMAASTLVVVVVLTVLQVWNDSLIMIVMTSNPSMYTLPVLVTNGFGGTGSLGASWLSMAPPLLVFLAGYRHFQRGLAPGPLF